MRTVTVTALNITLSRKTSMSTSLKILRNKNSTLSIGRYFALLAYGFVLIHFAGGFWLINTLNSSKLASVITESDFTNSENVFFTSSLLIIIILLLLVQIHFLLVLCKCSYLFRFCFCCKGRDNILKIQIYFKNVFQSA